MLFRFLRQARAIVMFGALFALTACPRTASKEEKALRAELRKALDEQNYERSADLARRHLKLKPMDNGTWDRLVRAQFGLNDLAGVKHTLEDWKRAVPKPSRIPGQDTPTALGLVRSRSASRGRRPRRGRTSRVSAGRGDPSRSG